MLGIDPTTAKDWEIAEAAEASMIPFGELGLRAGLEEEELIPMGRRVGKVDYVRAMNRLDQPHRGKYIDVTAITPTPLGEGKTTIAMGLVQGLGNLGKKGDRRDPAAERRPDLQHQGIRRRRRPGPVHSPDRVFLGLTGDIDSHHQRPQPGDGGPDLPDAARAQLRATPSSAKHRPATAGHRSGASRDQVGHGLLRPGAAQHQHRHRRQDGRLRDGLGVRDHRVQRAHGHPGRLPAISGTCGNASAGSSWPTTSREARSPPRTWKSTVP